MALPCYEEGRAMADVQVVETCLRCGAPRLAHILARCSDMCSIDLAGKHQSGYVPRDVGIGGGDDVQFTYCLECGQIQGRFPLGVSRIEAG